MIEANQTIPAFMAAEFEFVATQGDRSIYHRPGYGLQTYVNAIRPSLNQAGLPTGVPGFVSLMNQRVFRIAPNSVSNHAAALTAELIARNVPIGP